MPSPALFVLRSGGLTLCWTLSLCCGGLLHSLAQAQDSSPSAPRQEHPLVPAIQLVQQSYQVLQQVSDYEATLIKQELVNGRMLNQRMQMRIREAPFSVYLLYEEPNQGREILFVQGQNNNQLIAHEGTGLSSLVGTIPLAIDSPQVMAENRHVVTDLGMRRMLELVLNQWQIESRYGEIDVRFYPNAKMGNADCEVIETIHPKPRKQFLYHMTRLFLEKNSRLPIRIENYGWPAQAGQQAQLLEEYTYVNVRTNTGMTAADFDRRNPKYSFQ
jgi:hypothetical protein